MNAQVPALWAARFQRAGLLSGPCGLATHLLFQPDAFVEAFGPTGPYLQPPHGNGVGFDRLLEELDWTALD